MPQGFWLKTAVGSTWSKITNFYVKTSVAGWSQVQDAWIKTSTGAWTKFFSALMAPSQQVELDYQYGGYDSEVLQIRGKNYVWSPTPQSLKYYFRAVNEDGTTYVGSGGSSGATATNTISYYPGTSTYLSINPSDYNYKVGGLTKYFFEVRATGASGTVYSSLSSDVLAEIASPLAPTLTIQSSTSTSATVRITAASDTTGTWGFSSWGATYRYIIYTYDSVGGTIYTGGGRGGYSATSSVQDITLTGLTSGRTYYIYVLPVTGTVGTRPFPYNSSTQTSGYSGYPGVEAYITFQTASPPTIITNPEFSLQSGTANTVNSIYRLSSGTWNGSPTEYRYEIGRNDISGTVIAYYPSSTTWTTQTYYDHTFTSTTAGWTVYGSVIAKNANGQSSPAFATTSIGPIVANPQATGQYRSVTMPIAFTGSSQNVWVGTNGYVSTTVDPTTSPGTGWPSAGGVVIGPFVSDLVQSSLSYKSDSSNFWVKWSGYRLGDASKTCSYLMKFTWSSTTVDVYFIDNKLTDASSDAIRYGGSQYQTWANSTSISAFSEPTGMTSSTTNNGVDDNRTEITASKPALAGLTPTFGTNTATCGGFTGSVTNYSTSYTWGISVDTGSVSWGTASGSTRPFTVSGVSNNTLAVVTVTTSRSGYDNGSNVTSATSLLAPLTPTFGAFTTGNAGTGTVAGSVTNYNTSYTWAASSTAGTFTWGTAPQSTGTRTFSITGLTASQTGTVTVSAARTGYCTGAATSNTFTGPAAGASVPSTPSAPTVEYKSARNGRNYTWDVSFTFASGVTSMDVMNQYWSTNSGTYTSSPYDVEPANFNISSVYDGYIENRNFASGTAMPLTDTNGYWDNTYNWMRARIRAVNGAGKSGWSAWSSWA